MSIFNSVPDGYKVKVNRFDLSKEVLTTANFGNIYPVYHRIFTPNSFVKISPAAIVKTAPMYKPIYSGIKADFHCFAVPLRLLWDKFTDWVYDPTFDAEVPVLPPHINHVKMGLIMEAMTPALNTYAHTLAQDLGVPYNPAISFDNKISRNYTIYPFIAYHMIWNEYFRNENLQNEVEIDITRQDYSAIDTSFFTAYHKRNFAKDYFTSALPTAQKGVQAFVDVLNGRYAPVFFDNIVDGAITNFNHDDFYVLSGSAKQGTSHLGESFLTYRSLGGQPTVEVLSQSDTQGLYVGESNPPVELYPYADLQNISRGISVSDFRSLFAVQSYLEQLNVGGSRYLEGGISFYNCRIKDARAQRPEFLGMYSTFISPVQVVAHDTTTSLDAGSLTAFGSGAGVGKPFRYFCTEHTVILVLMSIKPKAYYLNGLHKEFDLLDQFDFPIPMFQHLGEEPIRNDELYYSASSEDSDTFGYQSRYAAWRSEFNTISGEFSSTLKNFHLGRIFNNLPDLDSDDFISVNGNYGDFEASTDGLNRVFNYTKDTADHFWCSIFFKVTAKLPFRYHSKPMLIG